ncbi:microneme protein MIC9 [Besnoitia besnoiti]|uniref:Microneme protein MIC9 n=1 Tax=Besnoitia besnoiti TaxID=94643 RepID=A0A2A9MQ98_BESBE|nr:microneme protein MIC9 [Besnoitia besnoiti]PFH38357.1 microneme protein MIC9 [Besnoitia besnoiti]
MRASSLSRLFRASSAFTFAFHLYLCVNLSRQGVVPASGLGHSVRADNGSLVQLRGESRAALTGGACEGNPCGYHGNCVPSRNGYTCACEGGYILSGGASPTCVNRDVCESQPCGSKEMVKECLPNGKYYACICNPGFEVVVSNGNPRCQRVAGKPSPCSTNPCGPTDKVEACLVTGEDTYGCSCKSGYEAVTVDGKERCDAIDYCAKDSCGPSKYVQSCTSVSGGYTCQCTKGAKLTGPETAPTCVAGDEDMTTWYIAGGVGGAVLVFVAVYMMQKKPSGNPNDPLYAHDFEGMY